MTNPVDDLGNVQVDFVWGNMPLQPDDQRGENTLDPALDGHIIATSGYEGFPGFVTGGVYDDTVANVAVPVLTGVLAATAATRLTNAGLVGNLLATTTDGATTQNNGKVASQTPTAGTVVNVGDTVDYSLFEYVSPGTTVTLTSSSVVGQNTQGGMQPLKGRANLINAVGGEQGSALFLAAANNGLVGKTITFSSDVAGTAGADGGNVSYFAGQTFTITASSSNHNDAVPGMYPAQDAVRVEWAPSGPNYGFSSFTAGTATISA
jgi:hypothetical protein